MDPREEMHVLVTQKLWGIGAEAMDLLVILCRIADPSITDDAVVPALSMCSFAVVPGSSDSVFVPEPCVMRVVSLTAVDGNDDGDGGDDVSVVGYQRCNDDDDYDDDTAASSFAAAAAADEHYDAL